MKKILAVLLSAIMLMGLLVSLSGCSKDRVLYNDAYYQLNEDGESYTLDYLYEDFSGTEFVVPDTVEEKPVTAIGQTAFADHFPNLTSITISKNVTFIGHRAFGDCTGLISIVIPEKVTTIESSAFSGCTSLKTVEFHEKSKLTNLGDSAFDGCTSLTSIILPEHVSKIGVTTFNGCSKLSSINIPGAVTSIGFCAFEGCESLKALTIPKSVTSIDDSLLTGTYFEKIEFRGTKSEWLAATDTVESDKWNFSVHCSDGTIEKYQRNNAQ